MRFKPSIKPKLRLLLPLLMSLGACGTTHSEFVNACQGLPLVTYSKDERNQAADALEHTPALSRMMVDYAKLRAAVRACAAVKG